jgi:hypothetical protein
MNPDDAPKTASTRHLVVVRPEPAGQYTARVVGLPEIRATAATEPGAIEQVRRVLAEWLASARWVLVEVPVPPAGQPSPEAAGHFNPEDPLEQEYLAELARFRQEDLERTLREYDPECSSSSSTPTT